jgi:hypothetical protein
LWLDGEFSDDERPDVVGLFVKRGAKEDLIQAVPAQLQAVLAAAPMPWKATVVRHPHKANNRGRRLVNRLLTASDVYLVNGKISVMYAKGHVIEKAGW